MLYLRKIFLVILLLGAGAGGLWLWQQRKPIAKADLTSLRTQLDAAAERNFLVPSLEVQHVEIDVARAKMESRVQSIIKRAEQMGGTAMQGLDREEAKVIMATLPKNRLEEFLASVQKPSFVDKSSNKKSATGEMSDCEIVIRPL